MRTSLQNFSAKQLFLGGLFTPVIALLLLIGIMTLANGFHGPEERHIRGSKNAKVQIVEYSDFQCPFCERAYPTMQQILKEYGNQVSLEYRHFPLSFHPYAEKAAEASECAAEQGKFWEFHDYAFEHQDALSFDALKQWARDLRLNTGKFDSCLDTGKYAEKVAAQLAEGTIKGVDGTPTMFINGQAVVGAQPYEAFRAAVDAALKK